MYGASSSSAMQFSFCCCFFILVCLACAAGWGAVRTHAQPGFCARTQAAPKSCPTPPTFDAINLTAYSGRWYQIGVSAYFQLVSEPGLVCGRVAYALQTPTVVSVVNSGLTILRVPGVIGIRVAGVRTLGVCTAARSSCRTVLRINDTDVVAAVRSLAGPATLKLVNDSAAAATAALDSAAGRITHIQLALNLVSQANYSDGLLNTTAALESDAGRLKHEDAAALRAAAKALDDTGRALQGNTSAPAALRAAGKTIRFAGKELLHDAKTIEKAAVQLRKIARSLSPEGNNYGAAITEAQGATVFTLQGSAVQVAGGKLAVNFFGQGEPYWVLAIEGDYEAALVYSCTNDPATGAIADKAIYVISRTQTLPPAVLQRFLALAASYGISSDCEDPFLLTVQRGGSCGLPSA